MAGKVSDVSAGNISGYGSQQGKEKGAGEERGAGLVSV